MRVPIAERAEDPALIAAALAVVGDWRYEPPTDGGEPVLVEERNTLTFRPRAVGCPEPGRLTVRHAAAASPR